MSQPLIGITTSRRNSDGGTKDVLGVAEAYVQSVVRAGGLPVLIPLGLSEDGLRALYARLDGILFTGGGDVEPQWFAGGWHDSLYGIDADRDRVEMALTRWAAEEAKPFLGICRGIQVVNVALGGSLHLDTSLIPGASKHDYYPNYPRDFLAHPVAVEEDSRLAAVLGLGSPSGGSPVVEVNSLHHQTIKEPAPVLQVVARAPDGVIEAVELPAHPFGLGVQWHPECLPDLPSARQLFHSFVQAAGSDSRVS